MDFSEKLEAVCLELDNQRLLAVCYWEWGLIARKQHNKELERDKLLQARTIFYNAGDHRWQEVERDLAGIPYRVDEALSGSILTCSAIALAAKYFLVSYFCFVGTFVVLIHKS